MSERLDILLHRGLVAVEHIFQMRPNNLEHQHVMFSVWALHPEMVQEGEDAIRPGVCP